MNWSSLLKLSLIILLFAACNATKNATTNTVMWVSGEKARCQAGAGEMDCLQVYRGTKVADADWELFYSNISGFNFERGMLQKIEVKEEKLPAAQVPADASSVRYTLVKVLEKRADESAQLTGTYQLTALNGSDFQTTENVPTITLDLSERQVSGSDGCNNYTGAIKKLTPNAIEFGVLAATKKMCRNLDYVTPFNQAMTKVARYKLVDGQLMLKDEQGSNLLKFRAQPSRKLFSKLHDIYSVKSIFGNEIKGKEPRPNLEINLTQMRIFGNDSCNEFNGTIKQVDEQMLKFDNVVATRKMCPNMKNADEFNRALKMVHRYERRDLLLVFFNEKGDNILTLNKVD